jgi:hypothetical protein
VSGSTVWTYFDPLGLLTFDSDKQEQIYRSMASASDTTSAQIQMIERLEQETGKTVRVQLTRSPQGTSDNQSSVQRVDPSLRSQAGKDFAKAFMGADILVTIETRPNLFENKDGTIAVENTATNIAHENEHVIQILTGQYEQKIDPKTKTEGFPNQAEKEGVDAGNRAREELGLLGGPKKHYGDEEHNVRKPISEIENYTKTEEEIPDEPEE